MGKTTKPKAAKSPKKTCAKSTSTGSKRTGQSECACRKAAAAVASKAQEFSDDELIEPISDTLTLKIPACVIWDKYPKHMEHLLNYLDAHPDVRIKLFEDSTQTAKLEGCSKLTAKSSKAAAYLQVADGIFSINDDAVI
jgi:hypothetical protein